MCIYFFLMCFACLHSVPTHLGGEAKVEDHPGSIGALPGTQGGRKFSKLWLSRWQADLHQSCTPLLHVLLLPGEFPTICAHLRAPALQLIQIGHVEGSQTNCKNQASSTQRQHHLGNSLAVDVLTYLRALIFFHQVRFLGVRHKALDPRLFPTCPHG